MINRRCYDTLKAIIILLANTKQANEDLLKKHNTHIIITTTCGLNSNDAVV